MARTKHRVTRSQPRNQTGILNLLSLSIFTSDFTQNFRFFISILLTLDFESEICRCRRCFIFSGGRSNYGTASFSVLGFPMFLPFIVMIKFVYLSKLKTPTRRGGEGGDNTQQSEFFIFEVFFFPLFISFVCEVILL